MTVIVKGIETRDGNGNPYLREDIDMWYREQVKGNRIQLTLFVEALALIQKRPLDDLFSYFRLAGIHSAPWCIWDDVELPPEKPKDDPERIPGYCVHNNYTFPTWHRVYIMLYERVLYDAMYEWIDKAVPTNLRKDWKEEADKWRLPYWDFALFADRPPSTPGAFDYDIDHDRLRLPILCMMPNVQIKVFENGKGPIIESRPNPLYKYVTPKLMGELPEPYKITGEDMPEQRVENPESPEQKILVNPKFTYPGSWDKCNATTKYGILDGFDESIWTNGGQNWLRANYALNEHPYYKPKEGPNPNEERPVPTLQDLVYRLFQYGVDSWGAFSTTRYTDGPKSPRQEKPKLASTSTESKDKDKDKEGNKGKNALNLEFIHNNIHNFVGGTHFLRPRKEEIHLWGSGHMSSVFMAAFDPIFFIFHNNIDRLTVMWQMLNWKKWFDDDYSKLTKCDELWPFHKTATTFWKSDCVREWRDLGYEYKILQGLDHNVKEDRNKVLEDIADLYGEPTKHLFKGLPDHDGKHKDKHDDFVITVIYDKYALNGAPYKINLFLDGTGDFRGPESEGFVASIYNFSGSLESGSCGESLDKEVLQPVYMAVNNFGKPVSMNVTVELHRSWRPYYANPKEPKPDDPLKYDFIKYGKQADVISMAVQG